MPRTYSVYHEAAHSTAITIIEITAGSGKPLEIIRAWVSQRGIASSDQIGLQLLRKTATITGTSLTTISKFDPTDAAAGFTAKHTATAEGTDGDVLFAEGFNLLNGWLYHPVPEERIFVPSSGILAIKLTTAPAAPTNFKYGFVVQEYG